MWGYFEYTPVAKKKEQAKTALEKLKKKDTTIQPVIIRGTKISNTWWGIAWTKNLESYSDYSNRIGRGRSYLRQGCVLDLKIEQGRVDALVQGGSRKPYEIQIIIDALPEKKWNHMIQACGHKIESIAELAEGKFPKELQELFTIQRDGLFPSPKEIHFDCSCPDWASMCKHVAAALFGIGARLDEDPTLFFKLRGINVEMLLKKSVEEKMNSMLKNSGQKTRRVIDDADIGDLFGV